jgi:hypothetical protein
MTSFFPKRWCAWPAAASYVLLALAGCASPPAPPPEAAPALTEAKRDFTYQGQPIHPALVHLFDGSEADDGPTILAVDVREAQNDNQFSTPVQRDGDVVSAGLPDTDPPERCHYRRLGVLTDGTQVVESSWNGGGSGQFEHLLLLRFYVEPFHRPEGTPDWRLALYYVGGMPLGDRDEARVTLAGDHVVVGATAIHPQERNLAPED